MDGDFADKYLHCVFGYLFWGFISAPDDRGQAKCKKYSDYGLYGKKQEADSKACESADGDSIDFSNDHGVIDYFVLFTVAEWENELGIAGFFEAYFV